MLKYVNTMVVFSEIPDCITLAINISNCPCHCPGCHSAYLAENIGTPLTNHILDELLERNSGIDCVCFMGGDAEPDYINYLADYIKTYKYELEVGWYSGRATLSDKIDIENFDYIKLGPYIEELGPLTSPTTNQKLWHIVDGNMEDITYKLQLWKI